MKVKNNENLPTAPISEMEASQGDLKYLAKEQYNQLKKVIEKRGFDIPVYVWIDDTGTKWLLDGHQRKRILTKEGWNDPIPYYTINAENMAEAMSRLLEITSQYGTITQEGIDTFIATYELPEAEVFDLTHFDGIKFYDLGTEVQDLQEKEGKSPSDYIGGELRDSMSISLTFDKASFVEFMTFANYFRELYGVETVTDAVVQAIREKYEDAIR